MKVYVFKLFCVSRQQMYEDTKGVVRSRQSKKARQCNAKKKNTVQTKNYKTLHRKLKSEQREPAKNSGYISVFKISLKIQKDNRKKSKDRQYNGQNKMDKGTNNDLQNTTYNTKDREKRTPLKHGMYQ